MLFILTPFCLEAGRYPTAQARPKACPSQAYLNRVLRRLDANKAQKQSLVNDLRIASKNNDARKVDDLLETLAVRYFLEQTMLLQAKIGKGELEQEESFFKKKYNIECSS